MASEKAKGAEGAALWESVKGDSLDGVPLQPDMRGV